jgi:hypothetical protein
MAAERCKLLLQLGWTTTLRGSSLTLPMIASGVPTGATRTAQPVVWQSHRFSVFVDS